MEPPSEDRDRARIMFQFAVGLLVFAAAFMGWFNIHRSFHAPYQDATVGELIGNVAEGRDLRAAVAGATALRTGGPISPPTMPFATAAYLPWTFTAAPSYHHFAILIILALFLTLVLPLLERGTLNAGESAALAAVLTAGLYHTYWFQLAIERDNADIFAGVMSAAGLFCVSRGRERQAVLWLTLAAQWRLTPALLGLLLIPRFGIARFLWFLALNAVAIFMTGLRGLQGAAATFLQVFGADASSIPGHSLQSASMKGNEVALLSVIALGTIVALIALLARRDAPGTAPLTLGEAAVAGMIFQLISLVPPMSADTALGLLVVPFLLMLTRDRPVASPGSWLYFAGTGLAAVALGAVSASGTQNRATAVVVGFLAYFNLAVADLPTTSESPRPPVKL